MIKRGLPSRIASLFLTSKLTPLIVVVILALGVIAILATPREEEPQIIVPMVDVIIPYPGGAPSEVEEQAITPAEKLLWGLPDVDYIYSTAMPGMGLITVRYKVGTEHENAVLRIHHRLREFMNEKPKGVYFPLIRSYTIDDVPFLTVTLHSEKVSPYELRTMAQEISRETSEIPDISKVDVTGGEARTVSVYPHPDDMAEYHVSLVEFFQPLEGGNTELQAGHTESSPEIRIDTGGFFRSADEIRDVVVGIKAGRVVRVRDVADVRDGAGDSEHLVTFKLKEGEEENGVTISYTKRPGTNATTLADDVLSKIESIEKKVLSPGVAIAVTRNYGETAEEKGNSLLLNLVIATILTVVVIALVLGIRYSLIIGVAVPTSLALTLFVYYLYGYTINRVTLFALIMTIGIIVDNAIVVVENIARHLSLRKHREEKTSLTDIILISIDEVGTPTILATIIIIASLLPMAFVRGLMGPYMRPIPIGASVAMSFSLLVAFVVIPWMTRGVVRKRFERDNNEEIKGDITEGRLYQIYRNIMSTLTASRRNAVIFFSVMIILLMGSLGLLWTKVVTVKMLPFDNKSEFQVVIDGDPGMPLEKTLDIAREMGIALEELPELSNYQIYAGTASPITFNGLVRHYFLRQAPHLADIQVNLAHKSERDRQSHAIAKSIRPELKKIADAHGVRVKVVEIPPGPPVLSTLVSEVYGPNLKTQLDVAEKVRNVYSNTPGVVDVDWFVDAPQDKIVLSIDRRAASMKRVPADRIAKVIYAAMHGAVISEMHTLKSREPLPIVLRLPEESRDSVEKLLELTVPSEDYSFVPLREIVEVVETKSAIPIHHKNLQRVVYVVGDVAGEAESPIYVIGDMSEKIDELILPDGTSIEQRFVGQPKNTDLVSMKWDGEWQISYEVFRDLGIAFGLVLLLIYLLVVGWFQSFTLPLIIMAPIPLSLIGVIPGHWIEGAFITATSFIGFIACAGIIVRNSILLIDFIEQRLGEGFELRDAVIDAGIVRFRPILLTAGTVVAGTFVMLFDPIFEGLAVSLIGGEILAIVLTPVAIPLTYYWFMRDSRAAMLRERDGFSGDGE